MKVIPADDIGILLDMKRMELEEDDPKRDLLDEIEEDLLPMEMTLRECVREILLSCLRSGEVSTDKSRGKS